MAAIQAIFQILIVVALSAGHIYLWPTLFEPESGWQDILLWGANWVALLFFFFSLNN